MNLPPGAREHFAARFAAHLVALDRALGRGRMQEPERTEHALRFGEAGDVLLECPPGGAARFRSWSVLDIDYDEALSVTDAHGERLPWVRYAIRRNRRSGLLSAFAEFLPSEFMADAQARGHRLAVRLAQPLPPRLARLLQDGWP